MTTFKRLEYEQEREQCLFIIKTKRKC